MPLSIRRFVALAVAATASGCYDYLGAPSGPQPADQPLRVSLSAAGTARVTDAYGPFIVALDATLQGSWPSDSLRVRVFSTRHQTGFRTDVAGLPLVLGKAEVDSVHVRKLNKVKTGMLAGVLAVLVGSLPSIVQNAGGGGGSGQQPPPAQP